MSRYLQLIKPRLVLLLLASAATSMVISDAGVRPRLLLLTLVGVALACGGASVLNNYLERETDALMERTRHRPLPSGAVGPGRALAFGLGLCLAGIVELALLVNGLSAGLAAAGIVYYSFVYTCLLKPRLPHSAAPGAIAGVLPLLIGWAATGRPLSVEVGLLCAIVFTWSPPHFWALTLAREDDYVRARIPVPASSVGRHAARLQVLSYSLALLALTVLPGLTGSAGVRYLAVSVVAGVIFVGFTIRMVRLGSLGSARLVYRLSGPYLAVIFAGLALGRVFPG